MPDSKEQLEGGTTLTVEPGVYVDGTGVMRIEDNVLVTKSGVDVLGPVPRRLSPRRCP